MSRAPFSHDTDAFTGVFVSITTSGMPFTHSTMSKRRCCPAARTSPPRTPRSELLDRSSKSISRSGTYCVRADVLDRVSRRAAASSSARSRPSRPSVHRRQHRAAHLRQSLVHPLRIVRPPAGSAESMAAMTYSSHSTSVCERGRSLPGTCSQPRPTSRSTSQACTVEDSEKPSHHATPLAAGRTPPATSISRDSRPLRSDGWNRHG